jgi:RNA polymerase sigma factor (sigma-70 family)
MGSTACDEAAPTMRTRQSLLGRLRNLDDHASWRTFFDIYWRLIYDVARHSGLDDDAAQEVVQDTVIGVARAMPAFRYDPEKGTFRQWLLRVTRRRIIDQFRRIYRQPVLAELTLDEQEDEEVSAVQVADYSGGQFECAWREEWERTVFKLAVAEAQREVNPKHFQVFDFCVVKDMSVSRDAAPFGSLAPQADDPAPRRYHQRNARGTRAPDGRVLVLRERRPLHPGSVGYLPLPSDGRGAGGEGPTTVLWINATTNATVGVIGTYSDPVNRALDAGATYLATTGLEAWTHFITPTMTAWSFTPQLTTLNRLGAPGSPAN